jgi:Nitroreductase
MTTPLEIPALNQLFLEARTYGRFLDRPVPDALLRQAWDLARMGPTAANTQPARVVFVRSAEAKARLKPHLAPGNADKTMAAPATAIIAYDLDFADTLPRTFPHVDARAWYVGNDALIAETAFRNGSLQGAYLILALRAVGLDCGPMSGFDAAGVDAEFFAGSRWRANFLVNIGYGDKTALHPRNPRLGFDEACRVV